MKEQSVKKKKKLPKVLLVIVLLIGALVGFIAFNASKNMEVMNRTLDSGMKTLSEHAEVTPVDAGEFSQIKMYGLMKFDVSQYDVKDIGNLSVMTVNMGFMQMVSYVITPYDKNMPLMSMDFMYILGNRKSYVEFYDLVSEKDSAEYDDVLSAIKEFENKYSANLLGPDWHKHLFASYAAFREKNKSRNKTRGNLKAEFEKQTLTAWARILNRRGLIDSARLGRMITLIGQMTESGMKKR